MFDQLEKRRLFSTMTVAGTAAADTIDINVAGPIVSVTVNGGSPEVGLDSQITDIIINANEGADVINLNANGLNAVTINGGRGNDTINIAATSHNLDDITDTLQINGDVGNDNVNFHDEGSASGTHYDFRNGNELTRPGMPTVTWSVESMALGGSSASDTFNVFDPIATPVTIAGNGGTSNAVDCFGTGVEDFAYTPASAQTKAGDVTWGGQDIAFTDLNNLLCFDASTASLTTPNGLDSMDLRNFSTAQSRLSGTSDGIAMTGVIFDDVGAFTLNMATNDSGTGDDGLAMNDGTRGTNLFKINSGSGNNAVTVNAGIYALDLELGAITGDTTLLTISSGVVTFSNTQHIGTMNLRDNGKAKFAAGTLFVKNLRCSSLVGNLELASSSTVTQTFEIDSFATLVKTGAGGLTTNGAVTQLHQGNSLLDVEQGSFNMFSDAGSPTARNLNVMAASGGTVFFNTTQHVFGIFADAGGIISQGGTSTVLVTSNVFANDDTANGQINLQKNDMIVDYSGATQLPFIQGRINVGRNNGNWNGQGILSSSANLAPKNTTLGAMEATDYKSIYGPGATFDGETIDNSAVLVKYTYYGDANFNGKIDGGDYSRTDFGFANHSTGWVNGDFNGDGKVNGSDYGLIDFSFGTPGGVLRPGAGGLGGGSIGGARGGDLTRG